MKYPVYIAASWLLCGTGCARDAAPVRTAAPPAPATHLVATPEKSAQAGTVRIAADIQKACGISDADAHFEFDSAALEQEERPVLGQLAKCFVSGPLAGKEMRLIGHADPRGESDYNMVLGGSRADTVKTFLTIKGVPSNRMVTTSRGELEATGTNEASWADDRRVDIVSR